MPASSGRPVFLNVSPPQKAPIEPVKGCVFCEEVGGRLLQHHEDFRVVAIDDIELPGCARVVWNHHVAELSELNETQRLLLMQALHETDLRIRTLHKPHKINIASFGNKVPHLHFHFIARWKTDPWWPESTWSERPAVQWQGISATGFAEAAHELSESEPALLAVSDWTQLNALAAPLRRSVFVEEQSVAEDEEFDSFDSISRHVVIAANHMARGTGRLAPDGRLGRVAVAKAHRNKGLGRVLVRALLNEAQRLGFTSVYLHAQVQALGFYEQFGFIADSEEFLECDIAHRVMSLHF
jgi:predicted GNAT family N-acyltransferase/diadenosine tetraphosphate (Ap4A) HIT family hydrolase